jgi:hypothetical protein
MSFLSWRFLLAGPVLTAVGCGMLVYAWTYADAGKREAATVGTITDVVHGRSSTYYYTFNVNGVRIADSSSTCKTALTEQRCKEGAQVLVYYDPEHLSTNELQEFRAASRERFFGGGWMTGIGLLMLGLLFWTKRKGADLEETDADEPDEKSEVLHITPGP